MFRVIACFVLLAVLATARAESFAAPQCNSTITCIHQGGSCNQPTNGNSVTCANGLFCSNGQCVALPTVGQSCTSACFDASFHVACQSGTCQYTNIYGPGEACVLNNNQFFNGGCPTGYTCSGTSPTCSVTPTGGNCTNILCHPTDFCDPITSTCMTRFASGAACNTTQQCQGAFVCTNHGSGSRTCQARWSQAVGAGCGTEQDCVANALCDLFGTQKCVGVTGGQDCRNNAAVCPANTACTCTVSVSGDVLSETGATCASGAFSQPDIDNFNAIQNCLMSHGCFDENFLMGGDGSSLNLGVGPNSCLSQCISSSNPFNQCGSSASALVPFLLLLLLSAAIVLFL